MCPSLLNLTKKKKSHRLDWIGLLLLIPPPLFWAGNFIIGRAMRGDVPPFTLLFWRWAIALALLLPFAWGAVRRDHLRYRQHAGRIVAISFAGIVAFNAFVYVGLRSTTASNALLLNSFIPIMIVLLAALFYQQRLQGIQTAGLILSFFGALTIILQGDWLRLASLSFSHGDLIVFCAMVAWAFYTLWLRSIPADINRIGLIAIQIAIGLLMLLPLYLWERIWNTAPVWNMQSIGAVAYLGIFPSVIAYLLYNLSVARVGAARAGLSIHLIPIFGVVLAVVFLHESLHFYHAVGMSAIAVGILLCAKQTCKAPENSGERINLK